MKWRVLSEREGIQQAVLQGTPAILLRGAQNSAVFIAGEWLSRQPSTSASCSNTVCNNKYSTVSGFVISGSTASSYSGGYKLCRSGGCKLRQMEQQWSQPGAAVAGYQDGT